MSAHTPGPWKVIEREVFSDQSVYPLHVIGGPDELQVCLLESQITATTATSVSERKNANARLIAAAPELLEALKLCAAVCAGETSNKNGLIRALEAARSAMNKATGAA